MSAQRKFLDNGVPEWIVTFADLMTLLFCFFVLLTTLSVQPKNCNGIKNYLNQRKAAFKNYELRSSKLECVLSLPSDYLFKSGGDAIQRRAFVSLFPMFKSIKTMPEHKDDLIIVAGHTDNVPIRTKRFPSNWELSSARATNIARFLVDRVKYPDSRVSINAFGEGRPKVSYVDRSGKAKTGATLRNARRINRRVEIILASQPKAEGSKKILFDGRH